MVAANPRFRRWLKRTAITAAGPGGGLAGLVVHCCLQTHARPHPPFAEPPPAVTWTTIEPVRLHTADGLELGAWYMPGRPDGPSAVVLHGFRSRRIESMPTAEILVSEGYNVLAVTCEPTAIPKAITLTWAIAHGTTWRPQWHQLETRRPGKPILVQGTSMGAAAAIYAAGRNCKRESARTSSNVPSTTSAPRSATASLGTFPGRWTARPMPVCGFSRPFFCRTWTASRRWSTSRDPGVGASSSNGRRPRSPCGAEEVKAVYDRIASHAKLVVFPEADHGHLAEQCGEVYRAAIVEFVRQK